jgi:tungstate transport system ATP-binding protein
MNKPIYHIQDVTKVYDQRHVLQVEALDIRPGEIFGLVGPSGAGKSTLLRLLNFLEPPTGGAIHFLDAQYDADSPVPLAVRRRVTTVFQRPILLNRSVQDNVAYGLRLRHQNDLSGLVKSTLEKVGLESLASQRARTLSGGEAQRVALARAMVIKPDVLLLDEPTANLDPHNVGLIEKIAQRLNQEQGMTLILVTHNVFQARRMAHRVALMLEGQIVEVADVDTFFEAPTDPRTAAFVQGEMIY